MKQQPVEFHAVILAGGRSSRLGGMPKQDLLVDGRSLLDIAIAAASGASRIVVVGPMPQGLPDGVLSCREQPAFAGPAAAIAAGLEALEQAGSKAAHTLVLACDMPGAAAAVAELKRALESELAAGTGGVPAAGAYDGVMARTGDGTRQPLAGIYRTAALAGASREMAARGGLINGSVRSLLARLEVQPVTVPDGSTADVDTWDDAAALGIAGASPDRESNRRGRS